MRTVIDRSLVAFRAKLRGLKYSVIDDDAVYVQAAGDTVRISYAWEPWFDENLQMDTVKTFVQPGEEDLYRPPRPLTFQEIVEQVGDRWTVENLSDTNKFVLPGTWLFSSKTLVMGTASTRLQPAVLVYVYDVDQGGSVSWSYSSAEISHPDCVLVTDDLRKLGWLLAEINYKVAADLKMSHLTAWGEK